MADYERKIVQSAAYTRGLQESRSEVPVRILWISCAAAMSWKTRALGEGKD
jgi:hypothetical protein